MQRHGLEEYCNKWKLLNPVLLASTFTSDIFKVQFDDSTAVLKILNEKGMEFEACGAIVLRYFNGNGAVRLMNADDSAHLLEYADGSQLKTLVEIGNDSQATEVVCDVLAQLHQNTLLAPGGLISMAQNFRSLFSKAQQENLDSIYVEGAKLAERLIATEQELRVLHGDIHHENILKSSERGWLAIDPQCLAGERTYDTANTFYNPIGFLDLALTGETIESRSKIFAQRLNLDRKRILEYAFAYGCLRAAWRAEDGQEEESTLRIAYSIRDSLRAL